MIGYTAELYLFQFGHNLDSVTLLLKKNIIILLFFQKNYMNYLRVSANAKVQRIFKLTLCLITVLNLPTFSSSFQLKDNSIINGNFTEPFTNYTSIIPFSIPGWNCLTNCQIDNCYNRSLSQLQSNQLYVNCSGQTLDLNSDSHLEVVSQVATLHLGRYQFFVTYFYPFYSANKKTFFIFFNNQLIFVLTPQVVTKFQTFTFSAQLIAKDGANNLTFSMTGLNDAVGFRIQNISLRRQYSSLFENVLNSTLVNPLTTAIISYPASRSILGQLINMFVNLQRLQLYFYHNREYSYNALLLLQNANYLMNLKGALLQNQIKMFIDKLADKQESIVNGMDFKYNYTSPFLLQKNKNGFSFIRNNANIFVYSLPIYIATLLLFNLLFRITFNWPVSKIIRKFYFNGILLFMITEGNIEQFTYYAFHELDNFFSFDFRCKMVNIFILQLYFVIFITSVGGLWWFRFHYKHNVKYLIEQNSSSLPSIWNMTVDRGLACVVCGIIHQTLVNYANLQLLLLGLVELVWAIIKIQALRQKVYRHQALVYVNVMENIIRIAFQFNCYLYANHIQMKLTINQSVFPIIIMCFLGTWLVQILISICYIFVEVKFVRSLILMRKVPKMPKISSVLPVNIEKDVELDQKQGKFIFFVEHLATHKKNDSNRERKQKVNKNNVNFRQTKEKDQSISLKHQIKDNPRKEKVVRRKFMLRIGKKQNKSSFIFNNVNIE